MVDGQIIVHSHPFINSNKGKSPLQSHSHLPASYFLIQQLMQANWESSPDVPQVPKPVVIYYEYEAVYSFPFIPADSYSYTQLRAPPIG